MFSFTSTLYALIVCLDSSLCGEYVITICSQFAPLPICRQWVKCGMRKVKFGIENAE